MANSHLPAEDRTGIANPCNVCLHRHTPEEQAAGAGHCYMWKEEPIPCNRPSFKLDEHEFMLDIARQVLGMRRDRR